MIRADPHQPEVLEFRIVGYATSKATGQIRTEDGHRSARWMVRGILTALVVAVGVGVGGGCGGDDEKESIKRADEPGTRGIDDAPAVECETNAETGYERCTGEGLPPDFPDGVPLPPGEPEDWERVVLSDGQTSWHVGFSVDSFDDALAEYRSDIEAAGFAVSDDASPPDLAARDGTYIVTVFGSSTAFGLGIRPDL